jgi:hypothetical protein
LTISTVIGIFAILNPSNGKPIFVFAFIFAGNPEPLPVKSEVLSPTKASVAVAGVFSILYFQFLTLAPLTTVVEPHQNHRLT